ncbi:MAG: GTPase [Xenococcaceae cyanobacterium]
MIYPGLLLQNRYRVERPLGKDGLGEKWEVDDDGTLKVLKVLHNSYPKAVELFEREANLLKQLNHPGIPKVDRNGYFTFWPESGSVPNPSKILPDNTTQLITNLPSPEREQRPREPLHCLIMEKIEGLNLQEWLEGRGNQPITEKQGLAWLKQLVEILAQVHEQKYFHQDIKPDNIIKRQNEQLVLIDFGALSESTATNLREVEREDFKDAEGYTPPEQFKGHSIPQSDFFALGRTFVYLLTGKPPTKFGENIKTGQLRLNWRTSAPQVSKPLADLIDELMAPSPEKRPENTEVILQRLALLEIELSIEPILKELPRAMRFLAKQILKHTFQEWVKQIRIPTIALYGRTNSGKSSLINAIMGKTLATVGTGAEPTTPDYESYECERNGWKLQFVDSRGVGELSRGESYQEKAFQQALDYIVNKKVDILLFVVLATESGYSDLDVKFLKALKKAHQKAHKADLPIILAINKIDIVNPPFEWSPPYDLSLASGAYSREPRTDREEKETSIRTCIQARLNEYKDLTRTYVPVCTYWDKYEDRRYNIDELELQIYNLIPDEVAKDCFGKTTADQRLKKAVASRFTSAAAWLAFFLFIVFPHTHTLDSNAVLNIQKGLVSMIAQIAGIKEYQSRAAEKLLKQLGVQHPDARSALSMTFALGEAATRCFIDNEEITRVKQTYTQEEERLEPEFQEAFKGGKKEVLKKMKEIDAELHERYGVKPIHEENEENYDII